MIGAIHMFQPINGIGLQHYLAVAGSQRPYTAEVFIVPDYKVAQQHHMVARVHGGVGGIAVPQFPDGGGTVLCHVAPTGIGGVGGHLQCQVAVAVFGEGAHKVLDAHHTGGDMPAEVVHGLFYDIVHHIAFIAGRGDHPESKRQYVGSNGVVGVASRLGVEETGVKSLGHGVGFVFEVMHVVIPVEARGKPCHNVAIVDVVWSREAAWPCDAVGVARVYQLGAFGRHAPVAVGVADKDAVLEVVFLHVEQPPFHGVIVLFYGTEVAKTPPNHVGHRNEGTRPSHVVGVVAPIGGGNVGE